MKAKINLFPLARGRERGVLSLQLPCSRLDRFQEGAGRFDLDLALENLVATGGIENVEIGPPRQIPEIRGPGAATVPCGCPCRPET